MDTHVIVNKDQPKTSRSSKKRPKKSGIWRNLSGSNKVSLVLIFALLIIFPVALFAMLSPKIPLFSGASNLATPITPPIGDYCGEMEGNLIKNYNFEKGERDWKFSRTKDGRFRVVENNYSCKMAASVQMTRDANTQLYQSKILLKPNTTYEFAFAAKASVGKDIIVILHKHQKPYTEYGRERFALTNDWQEFTTTFTTPGNVDTNSRLRFWFNSKKGDEYFVDNVVLNEAGLITPVPTSTPMPTVYSPTPTYSPTLTPAPTSIPGTCNCTGADYTGDGFVDRADLSYFSDNCFGKSYPQPSCVDHMPDGTYNIQDIVCLSSACYRPPEPTPTSSILPPTSTLSL